MSFSMFDAFPDEARLWIYAADRLLDADEQTALKQSLSNFFSRWQSHGRTVRGAAAIVEDRFLLVAGFIPSNELSGCGIDSSVNVIEEVGHQLDIEWLPALAVFFRDRNGTVRNLSRPAFREQVKSGTVTQDTAVFDLSIETVGELRTKGLERPAGDSWHALAFRIPKAA